MELLELGLELGSLLKKHVVMSAFFLFQCVIGSSKSVFSSFISLSSLMLPLDSMLGMFQGGFFTCNLLEC